MTATEFLDQSGVALLADHLWQSTLVVALAWLLTKALRNNHARTRFIIWLIASVKFLVPFSIFVGAGEYMRPTSAAPIHAAPFAAAVEQFTVPFAESRAFPTTHATTALHPFISLQTLLICIWALGALALSLSWLFKWLKVRAHAGSASSRISVDGVPVLLSSSLLEPGVFGIFRPVLVLPAGILARLSPEHLRPIIAHELCHIRRKDNLTFAVHMIVETLFWFHPLVWFLRKRLVEERELACDESVLQSGSNPEVYAEGILSICKFYVESPLACVSGVGGSDLKKRIVRIMADHAITNLDFSRKILLASAALFAIAVPTAIGLFHAAQTPVLAQAKDAPVDIPKFDVASIKPAKADDDRVMLMFRPDGVAMTGTPVQLMLRVAFDVEEDRIIGAPDWVRSNHYDIEAKVAPEDAPKLDKLKRDERNQMLQPLLADRFHLKYHHETRELPVYALVIAKGGSKLVETKPDAATTGPGRHSTMINGRGKVEGHGSPMDSLSHVLSTLVGRTVLDKTGLTGSYDYTLTWTPDMPGPPGAGPGGPGGPPGEEPAPDANGPTLFTALQEELGLKLESQKGPVDVIVIDHIEPPTPN